MWLLFKNGKPCGKISQKQVLMFAIFSVLALIYSEVSAQEPTEPTGEFSHHENETESSHELELQDGEDSDREARAFSRKSRVYPSHTGAASNSQFKCDFVGALALKDQCVRYLQCSKLGLSPVPTPCPGGKYFDHRKRTCMKKHEAQCISKIVCPKPGIKYPDETNKFGLWYLVCQDGIPYPKKCPAGQKFDEQKKDCVAPKG